MKRLLLLFVFAVLCVGVSPAQQPRYKLQKPVMPGRDLILEIPAIDGPHVLLDLKKTFTNFRGVEFTGYCPSRKWIFLRTTEAAFFNALIAVKELDLVYYVRQELSAAEARKECNNYQPVELSSTISNE